jgi:hypothetical protein
VVFIALVVFDVFIKGGGQRWERLNLKIKDV